MILLKSLTIVFFVFLLGGCFLSQKLSEVSYLDLDEIEAEKKSFSIAVVFSKELKNHMLSSYPAIPSYSEIELEVGQCLCSYLEQAAGVAYQSVTVLEEIPQADDFDRILHFSLDYSSFMFSSPSALDSRNKQIIPHPNRITYILSVELKAFQGRNLELVGTTKVEANSSFRRGGKEEEEHEKLKDAVRRSVRQVSFKVANLLLSGFAEPKGHPLLSLSN